jgi:hypothetical protein
VFNKGNKSITLKNYKNFIYYVIGVKAQLINDIIINLIAQKGDQMFKKDLLRRVSRFKTRCRGLLYHFFVKTKNCKKFSYKRVIHLSTIDTLFWIAVSNP